MRASHQLSPVLAAVVVAALFVSSASTALAQTTTHTVQPSENLFRIGLRYGVSWQAIMQANGLTSTTIYVGQQLVIPVEGAPPAVAPTPTPQPAAPTPPGTPPPPAPAPTPAPAASTYLVQRGDTLFRIATRFGLTTAQLAAANNIFNPALIYPGQVLAIPGSATGENPNPAAPPPSTGAGKRILVDISEQHLYAYEGDQLIFSFVASTGAPGLGTRPGNYSVQNKIPNAYGGTWNIWMPNWLGIYWAGSLQNGIHALPILPDGSRLWAGYLGTPVSYGCVILGVQESQQLYDWAEVGIPVDIQY